MQPTGRRVLIQIFSWEKRFRLPPRSCEPVKIRCFTRLWSTMYFLVRLTLQMYDHYSIETDFELRASDLARQQITKS